MGENVANVVNASGLFVRDQPSPSRHGRNGGHPRQRAACAVSWRSWSAAAAALASNSAHVEDCLGWPPPPRGDSKWSRGHDENMGGSIEVRYASSIDRLPPARPTRRRPCVRAEFPVRGSMPISSERRFYGDLCSGNNYTGPDILLAPARSVTLPRPSVECVPPHRDPDLTFEYSMFLPAHRLPDRVGHRYLTTIKEQYDLIAN